MGSGAGDTVALLGGAAAGVAGCGRAQQPQSDAAHQGCSDDSRRR